MAAIAQTERVKIPLAVLIAEEGSRQIAWRSLRDFTEEKLVSLWKQAVKKGEKEVADFISERLKSELSSLSAEKLWVIFKNKNLPEAVRGEAIRFLVLYVEGRYRGFMSGIDVPSIFATETEEVRSGIAFSWGCHPPSAETLSDERLLEFIQKEPVLEIRRGLIRCLRKRPTVSIETLVSLRTKEEKAKGWEDYERREVCKAISEMIEERIGNIPDAELVLKCRAQGDPRTKLAMFQRIANRPYNISPEETLAICEEETNIEIRGQMVEYIKNRTYLSKRWILSVLAREQDKGIRKHLGDALRSLYGKQITFQEALELYADKPSREAVAPLIRKSLKDVPQEQLLRLYEEYRERKVKVGKEIFDFLFSEMKSRVRVAVASGKRDIEVVFQ